MIGDATFRPVPQGGDDGILEHVLGKLQVAHVADHGSQDPTPLLAHGSFDCRPRSIRRHLPQTAIRQSKCRIGRISIEPMLADGIRDA